MLDNDAFRKSVAQNPRFRLILLGEGSLSSSIERFISECGLNNLVYRAGMISQGRLPDYFRAADLYVSCSLSDGSSVSLLEAIATGLPVVVTEAPGNREWVVTSDNGWLAAPGDADAFKRAMLDAAKMTHSCRERMAMANRRPSSSEPAGMSISAGCSRLTIISKRNSDFPPGKE